MVIGVVLAVGIAVGGFFAWRYIEREVLPEIEEATGGLTAFSETPPGPCIDIEADNGLLAGWTEASCDGPRDAEVTYTAAFNEGPFPGDRYVADQAAVTCRDAFEGYVGIPPAQSRHDFSWMVPTQETWAAGSRHGICLVVPGEGTILTGVVKGSEE